jgi:isopenicillin-N epimerase
LDPDVLYLNHGTVGVAPRRVLLAQQAIRDEMERAPSRFLLREVSGLVGQPRTGPTRMREAAEAVARFIGARGSDIVFVDNATTGANAVLRSFALEPGDEILLTDHNYGATARAAQFVARERRATVATATVPYPSFDRARLVEAIEAAITPRTRLAVIDHITSESAIAFYQRDRDACRRRGVALLVDGAHAPGELPLDVPAIGGDWYVANLHKWAHAPRSSGFLWTHPSRQAGLHPVVISWGLDQGYLAEFDWVSRGSVAVARVTDGIAFCMNRLRRRERYNHARCAPPRCSPIAGARASIDERPRVHGHRAAARSPRRHARRRRAPSRPAAVRGQNRSAGARGTRTSVDAHLVPGLQRVVRVRTAGRGWGKTDVAAGLQPGGCPAA